MPVFLVEGWALHRSDPIEKIDVLVNGRWVQRARLGIARPDVRDHYDLPDAIISGFECWVDLAAESPPASHVKLQLVAWVGAQPTVLLALRVDGGRRRRKTGASQQRRHPG